MSFNSTENSTGNNIVTHIRDLLPLPRHATFHVKLVIHQLLSVPLISGEFGIKWKFTNVQAVNSAGRPLGMGRALALKLDNQMKRHGSANGHDKGKGKEVQKEVEEADHNNEPLSRVITSSPTPMLQDADLPDSSHSDTNSRSGQATSSSNSNLNSRLNTTASDAVGIDYLTEARGHTPFLPLRDFKVDFGCEMNVAVQMSIEKDSLALLPSELKLTVMQRVIHGDPEAPLNPRLGHVQVNLAEYTEAGPVTRNYLLRRSKVNAMLNMTITMSQISGEENYRAPPLRKEEIKAGISEFLSASGVPLPSLSRHMTVEDPWLSSSLSEFIQPNDDIIDEPEEQMEVALEVPTQSRSKKRWRVVGGGKRGASSSRHKTDTPSPPPKISSPAPRKHQLHPTEALIEAIFNPYPSTSGTVSPFTYYAPPAPPPKLHTHGSAVSEGNGTDGTSRGSFDSSQRTSASVSEQGHDGGSSGMSRSGSGNGSGGRWWRRKTASRPVTPARMDSARS